MQRVQELPLLQPLRKTRWDVRRLQMMNLWNARRMKFWEVIADNLSKAGWSWAASQRLIPTDKRSSLLMHTATTERDSSSPPTRN
jgi:hypothetical protein